MNLSLPSSSPTGGLHRGRLAACATLLFLLPFSGPLLPAASESPARSAEAERATFLVDDGLAVDLVAAEPLVKSPAAMAWDEHAVLHVAENPDYPVGPAPGKPPGGAIVRVVDREGDGRLDERVVFADGLGFPNGLMPWRGGWLVTDAPNLWWLSDTNGDGRADVREVWFTGFATNQTTQLRACYPTLGPDGWIYVARGWSGGVVTSPKWTNLPPVDLKDGDFRFRPDGSRAEAIGANAQFGMVLDDVGRRFLVSNRNPLMHAVVTPRWWRRHPALRFSDLVQDVSPSGYDAKVFPLSEDSTTAGYMPELLAAPHAGTFTAASGIHQHFGEGLPPGYQGDWFICESAQNLVQRQIVEPVGATFRSRRVGEGREFLASTDGWFRPVFATTGPDGALYVADLYRKVIDHPDYLPAEVRGQLDFNAGKDLGRLWRVRATAATSLRPVSMAGRGVSDLLNDLAATNVWVRQTAHRLLMERSDTEVLGPLVDSFSGRRRMLELGGITNLVLRSVDPVLGPHLGAVRRTWLLASLLDARERRRERGSDAANRAIHEVLMGLFDPSPSVRETTWRVLQARDLEPKHALPDVGYEFVERWADDPSSAVRFHFALQCGNQDDWTPVVPALVRVARRDAGDRWTRAAVLSGLRGREDAFVERWFEEPSPDTAAMADFLGELAWQCAAGKNDHALGLLLGQALGKEGTDADWIWRVLTRLSEGLRSRGEAALGPMLEGAARDNPRAREWLNRWRTVRGRALGLARDPAVGLERRVAAVHFLGEVGFDASRDTLAALLRPGQPGAVQRAAVQVLGRFAEPEVGGLLANSAGWDGWPQSVRSAAIAVLVERPERAMALFEAMERGALPVWVVEPSRRRSLQNHAQPAVRDRARKLFAEAGGGDRWKVFGELKPVLTLPTSVARGREVFLKACASCHRHRVDGVSVGPDLSGVKNQPAEALLLHIVVPDAEIYPGFQACEIETTDGRSLSGLVVSETPETVVLRKAGGEEEVLVRGAIRSLSLGRSSLMPQELERTMTKQELADLIGFLKAD